MPAAERFGARVRKQGVNLYVEVPAAVSHAFATHAEKGRIRVVGSLEGAQVRGTLVPRGGGHWLYVHSGIKAAAGVEAGDRVALELAAVPWEEVPIAEDLQRALEAAGAHEAFARKSPSERHELQRWVDIATSPRLRSKRIAATVAQVEGRTEPLKAGQAARRRAPIWTCPKCGHRFAQRNQWHSCRRYSLEETFAKSEPQVRALFERVRQAVEALGPVHLQAYRDKVAFLVRVRFLGAIPKKRWLDLGFWLPRRVDNPRFHRVETLTPSDHVHLLRLRTEDELDNEVRGWMREAYAVGEQRHLE